MTRLSVSRPVRTGLAVAGAAGLFMLAGCSAPDSSTADTGTDAPSNASSSESADAPSSGGVYQDGTYSAEGSYQTPESVETVDVTLTLTDGVVSEVEVTGDPQARESKEYQGKFISGISDEVVGKSLDEISVDRVAGSSLTSGGFSAALETIKQEAAA